MISIHNVKEILIIRNFHKNMLRVYQYSISFFGGIFITFISVIGFVYSFYYAARYAIWLLTSTFIGYSLVIYSNGILAKYQNNERRYKEIMNITKDMAKYIIIVLFALSLKEWFI